MIGIQVCRLTVILRMLIFSPCIVPLYLRPSHDASFFIENVAISRQVVPAGARPPSCCRSFAGQSRAGLQARPIRQRVTAAGAKDAGQRLAASGWSEVGEGGAQFNGRFCGRKDFSQTKRQDKSNIGLKEEPIYLRQCSRIVIIPAAWRCDAM